MVKVILPDNQTRSKNISHCWTLYWFIPTAPVVHRSALYKLVNSDTDEDTATFKEIVEEPAFLPLINRQNASGSTLLHEACRNNSPGKAAILVRKGVELERKVEGQEEMDEGDLVKKYLVKNENHNEVPMTSLVKSLEEDEVRQFLEKMTNEITDVAKSKFIGMENREGRGWNTFDLACLRGDWKSALSLHALGLCQREEDQGKEIDQILSERSKGIVHVVEHPALENLLEEWAAAAENEKEAAEKKIDDIFDDVDVKVLFIQVGDSQREQLSRILKEWNCGRNNKGEWNCLIFLISIGNENLSK